MGHFVSLLFSSTGEEVLMQMKGEGEYTGKFTGITGYSDEIHHYMDHVTRSITAQTGILMPCTDLHFICGLTLPSKSGSTSETKFFSVIVEKDSVIPQSPFMEPIMWMPPRKLDSEPELFADVGILQYAVHRALQHYDFGKRNRTQVNFIPSGNY